MKRRVSVVWHENSLSRSEGSSSSSFALRQSSSNNNTEAARRYRFLSSSSSSSSTITSTHHHFQSSNTSFNSYTSTTTAGDTNSTNICKHNWRAEDDSIEVDNYNMRKGKRVVSSDGMLFDNNSSSSSEDNTYACSWRDRSFSAGDVQGISGDSYGWFMDEGNDEVFPGADHNSNCKVEDVRELHGKTMKRRSRQEIDLIWKQI